MKNHEELQVEDWDVNFGKLWRKLYSSALRMLAIYSPVDGVRMLHFEMETWKLEKFSFQFKPDTAFNGC